jgi:hypothetical protein
VRSWKNAQRLLFDRARTRPDDLLAGYPLATAREFDLMCEQEQLCQEESYRVEAAEESAFLLTVRPTGCPAGPSRAAQSPSPWDRWNSAVSPTGLIDKEQDHRFDLRDLELGCHDARCIHRSSVARRHDPGGLDHPIRLVHGDLK